MSDENVEEDYGQAISQQSQPSTSKRKGSLSYSEGYVSKKNKKLPNANDTYSASGLKKSQHGVMYQLKILMMLAKRCQKYGYSFSLATEKDDAGKFDDAVLEYKKSELPNVINYIFLQAKHTQEKNASKQVIKENDLLTETENKFCLHKYFYSYQEIKRNYKFQEESQTDFIIYTNRDFGFDSYSDRQGLKKLSSLYFKNIPNPNELLNIENKGNCYQLHIESKSVRCLKEIFENTSDCQKLTNDLVECILNEKTISLIGTMKDYRTFLAKYVFDLENQKFNKDFMNCNIGSELAEDIKAFRAVLLEKIRDYLQKKKKKSPNKCTEEEKTILKELSSKPQKWSAVEELKLTFSEGFREIVILEPNPQIPKPRDVTNEICKLIDSDKSLDKPIHIRDAPDNQIILEKHNLAGHVLVEKIEGKKKYVGFSEKFLSSNDLPRSILELRNELMHALRNKPHVKSKLGAYRFNIDNFKTCQESDLESLLLIKIPIPERTVTEADIKDFFKHLYFMVNQPNENELTDAIGEELKTEFRLIDNMLPTSDLQNKFLNWFKERMGSYMTKDKIIAFFDDIKSSMATISMIGQTSNYTKKLKDYELVFENLNPTVRHFIKHVEDPTKIFIFITPKDETMLGSIEVSQILGDIEEYSEREDSYVFVDLSTFRRLKDRIELAFKKTQTQLLIIEFDSEEPQIDNLARDLSAFLAQNKKLLLISSKGDELINGLKNSWKNNNDLKKDKLKETETKNTFIDLTKESQEKLLRNKVNFQGNDVCLNQIITTSFTSFKLLPLIDLLKKRFKIGQPLPISSGYNIKYYIDRTFQQCTAINEDFLQEKGDERVATNIEEFRRLREEDPGKNIHLLQRNESGHLLVWKKTHGSLIKLKKYLLTDAPTNTYSTERDKDMKQFIQQVSDEKIMIIADTAGMGKSTVLTHLSKKIKEDDHSRWVGRINLIDHTEVLQKNKTSALSSSDIAMEFVVNDLLKIGSDFDRAVFKSLLDNKKVVLMLDGFDEISPTCKSTVIELLRGLKEASVEQLWVATRPHLHIKEDLENELQQFTYFLRPYTDEDQINFLTKYWKEEIPATEFVESKVRDRAEKVINLYSSINNKQFNGIALHTYMLAVIFRDKKATELNLFELYTTFLNKKLAAYISKEDKMVDKSAEILRSGFETDYQYLAIRLLHLPKHRKLLLKQFRRLSYKKLVKLGIVEINPKPNFIHRTYTEYYAALFFIEQLKKEEQTDEIRNFILEEVFLSEKHRVVRSFINSYLQKKTISSTKKLEPYAERMCVLHNDNKLVQSPSVKHEVPSLYLFIQTTGKRIADIWGQHNSYCTGGGGTILHQAIQENNVYILKFLLKSLRILKDDRKLLVKRLLLHQDSYGYTIWVGAELKGDTKIKADLGRMAKHLQENEKELLLATDFLNQTSLHRMVIFKKDIIDSRLNWAKEIDPKYDWLRNKDLYNRTAFSWAVQYSNVTSLTKLWDLADIECKASFLQDIDDHGNNIWYWAALNNDIKVLEQLWEWKKNKRNTLEAILSAWFVAGRHGNIQVLEKLRKWFPNVDLFGKKMEGETIWILAAGYNKIEVLKYILKHVKDNDAKEKILLSSKLLKASFPNINKDDEYPKTAFHIAVKWGFENMLDLLWDSGGESKDLKNKPLNSKNIFLKIAWHCAMNSPSKIIGKLLDKLWAVDLTQLEELYRKQSNLQFIWMNPIIEEKYKILEQLKVWTKRHFPGRFSHLLSSYVWYIAIRYNNFNLFDTLWNWSIVEEGFDWDDLRESIGRTGHRPLVEPGKIEIIKKLLTICEKVKFRDFQKWFTDALITSAPDGSLVWSKNDIQRIIDLIRSCYKKNNNESEDELLNGLCYFAILNGYIDIIEINSNRAAYLDNKELTLIYYVGQRRWWHIIITLFKYGCDVSTLSVGAINQLDKYLTRRNDDDNKPLLEKVTQLKRERELKKQNKLNEKK